MTETDSQPVTTPDGIPGFEKTREWRIERSGPDAVFYVLRSVEQPDIGLFLTEPWGLAPGYEPDLPDHDLARIGVHDPGDLELYVVATIAEDRRSVYLNLAAPLVVNSTERIARQVILDRQGWPLRHAVGVRG